MLANLLYEKIGQPQTAKDDLRRSLPDLFGSRARGTLKDLVMQPVADFYHNSELGTLPTALSYFVQPNGGPFDELSIQLANYYQSARWTASIGAHVAPAVHQPDYDNWGFNMTWHGRNSSNTSGL